MQDCGKILESQLDEKEKDAFETGIRKSIRSQFLSELSDVTATIAIKAGRSSDKINSFLKNWPE